MRMKLCFVFLSLVLLGARKDAMAEGSVQYNPGNARPGNLQYCPAASASGQSISYAPQGALFKKFTKVKDEAYEKAWSGTWKDLESIVANAEEMYGFENTKHLGRNATMLVPATKQEMEWVIKHGGKWDKNWKLTSVYHQDERYNPLKWGNTKYKNLDTGSEVVYDDSTGRIIMDEKLGTRNLGKPGFWSATFGKHKKLDMRPHDEKADPPDKLSRDGDQYKYVGILYAHDPNSPDKFYIIDGQTGLPMTPQQVAEMPTTLSDMWKDMGLACVSNDARDMVPPKKDSPRDSSRNRADNENVEREKPGGRIANDAVVGEEEKKNEDSGSGVRGWCTCPNRSAHITLGNLFRMGEDFNVADFSYFFCSDCYKVRKNLDGVARLTGYSPIKIWDVSVARKHGYYGKGDPDAETLALLKESQEKLFKLADGQIVVPGLCKCKSPTIWRFGEYPHKFEMCKRCGRPRSGIPLNAKNTRVPNKLRRCVKTPDSPFVCTCKGATGLRPEFHTSISDDGEAQFYLMCTKCMQVKYSAFAPMREFKRKFPKGPSDPAEFFMYMLGTTDAKAALETADKEAAGQLQNQ